MHIVIEEKDFARNKPYRVEIKFNDEKVAEILKYAKDKAKDGIINSSDVVGWIPSAVEGNMLLVFPETDTFYYICPKCWKMDIVSRVNDDKLSGEIIAEICLKTAKNLTALLQADLKMHETPPSFDEFIKANFENFPELRGRRIGYKEPCSEQTLEILVKYKKTLFENEDWTYNIDVNSIFDEQVDFVQFHIDTGSFVFEKTIENDQEGFYEKIVNSLLDVPMIGEALSISFKKAYRNITKDLNACRVAHNEKARKTATDSEMAVRIPTHTDPNAFEVRMAQNDYVFRIFCKVSPGLHIQDMDKYQFWSTTSMLYDFNIVVNSLGNSSRLTARFQRDLVESYNYMSMAVTEFLRGLVDYPNVVAENLLEHFRIAFIKEFSKDTPSQEISKEEILHKVHELHRKEMEWKMLDRHYRQKFFNEVRNSSSVSEYRHSKEIDNLKKSMQRLGVEIEDLYAKICSDLS